MAKRKSRKRPIQDAAEAPVAALAQEVLEAASATPADEPGAAALADDLAEAVSETPVDASETAVLTDDAATEAASTASAMNLHAPWWGWAMIALFAASLLFGAWGLVRVLRPAPADAASQLSAQRAQIAQLQEEVAGASRSEAISREATQKLQASLADRDERIAALEADVAFYERFVGPTAQRRGLAVHAFELRPLGGTQWRSTSTLVQNTQRDGSVEGQVQLQVAGLQDGKAKTLDWATLQPAARTNPVRYGFRYFQRVDADFALPQGFTPETVVVKLRPTSGNPVEQRFAWKDVANESTATP